MTHDPALPIRPCLRAPRVLAVLLHPPGGAETAVELAGAWRPAVPMADVSTLSVPKGGASMVSALLARQLNSAGLGSARLVLAGVCGAEGTALQLAFGRDAPACAGVLACGGVLPPLAPLAAGTAGRGTRLRLVWQASRDPLPCAAALGELLRWFRTAGLDAQGTVLGEDSSAAHGIGAARRLSPAARAAGRRLLRRVGRALSQLEHPPFELNRL